MGQVNSASDTIFHFPFCLLNLLLVPKCCEMNNYRSALFIFFVWCYSISVLCARSKVSFGTTPFFIKTETTFSSKVSLFS